MHLRDAASQHGGIRSNQPFRGSQPPH